MEYYSKYNLKPDIEVSDNAFKITLTNTNYNRFLTSQNNSGVKRLDKQECY